MKTHRLTRRAAVAGLAGAAALAAAPALAQDALAAKGYAVGDIPLGAADAPVTVIEYASLTCPHCANFHVQSFDALKKRYIDTGKVRFVMREIYFDQFGLWATMIARCAGPENYYFLIDRFLTNQREWYQSHVRAYTQTKNPGPIVEAMMKIGRAAGMSDERMKTCLRDEALLKRLVEDFQTHSGEDGVNSTPTFIINGDKVTGEMSPDALGELIDKHL